VTRTADAALDPFAVAVLESTPSPMPLPAVAEETARVVGNYPWKSTVETNLSSPAILVLSEMDYRGWRVRVDGGPAESLRAYGVLRAVALPAGQHVVEWSFRPVSVFAGLACAALAVIGVLAGATVSARRNRTSA